MFQEEKKKLGLVMIGVIQLAKFKISYVVLGEIEGSPR
jgi:hypothetical protein